MSDPVSKTTNDPGDIMRAIAAMHDRAALHVRGETARLVHEQCAMHLRAISDDPEAIRALVEQVGRTEVCTYDI